MKSKTSNIWWCMANGKDIYFGSNALTRRSAIQLHLSSLGFSEMSGRLKGTQLSEWNKCKKRGDRVIKVRITPVKRKKK